MVIQVTDAGVIRLVSGDCATSLKVYIYTVHRYSRPLTSCLVQFFLCNHYKGIRQNLEDVWLLGYISVHYPRSRRGVRG